MKSVIALSAAAKSANSARFRHFLLRMPNQGSTNESQEACNGNQWNRKRQGMLVSSAIRDVTERKKAEEALREASRRLAQLREEERRHLARELHDGTAQAVAALMMNLARVQAQAGSLPAEAQQALEESYQLGEQCSREIRTVSYLLHPPLLEELGLCEALLWYSEGFARRSGIHLKVDIRRPIPALPREVETTLFRLVQESLSNIHRHSRSLTAQIRLLCEDSILTLEVADQGTGMPGRDRAEGQSPSQAEIGVGIASMQERVAEIGGHMHITSGRHGTAIKVTLTLERGSNEASANSPGR